MGTSFRMGGKYDKKGASAPFSVVSVHGKMK